MRKTLQKATGNGFRGSLATWLESRVTRKTSLSMTLQISACASHMACFVGHNLQVQLRKPLFHRFFTKLSHTILTLNLTKIQGNG